MTFLQQMYPGDAIASFIIRVLAEISLVTVVALIFGRVIVRRNPALRHGVCVCALLCVLAAPVTTFGLQRLGWSTLQIALEPDQGPGMKYVSGGAVASHPVVPARRQPFWTLERARSAASLTILVWLAGSGFLLVRLVGGVRKVRRLKMTARHLDHPKLRQALDILNRSGKVPAVPILFSKRLHSPIVVGPCDTAVILPEKLLSHLDEEQLQCVLAHEFTHVRQRDPLIGLVQRIVEAGYWPHPLVHVLNRDLIRAREEVCDNVALHETTAPQYADTLLTVALGIAPRQSPAPGGTGLMTRHWRLEERVKGLLDPNRRLTTTMNTRHLVLMAITLAGGTTVIAGARIVASPNPRVPQDSVELLAHYNPKTHSVAITQKSHKKAAQVVSRKANATSKTYKTVRIEPMSFTVASSAVHEGKSTTAKIARISEPVVVQYVTADGKASKVADPAKAVVTYSTASGEPVVVKDVNSDSTAVTITSVATGEVKRPAIVYQVKPVESHGTITYTTTTSSQDKVGKVLIAHSSTVSEVKSDQVVLARPVPEGDSKHVFVQLKDSEPKTGLVFVKAKGGAERGIEVFANPNIVDSTGKTVFVQAKDVDPASKSSGSKEHIAYTITADPLSQIATASEIRLNTNYKPMVVKDGRLSYTIENQKSNKPTIVTIQGGDIKIEGENIKVVYVKPTTKPPHQAAQKSQIKVKSKGK